MGLLFMLNVDKSASTRGGTLGGTFTDERKSESEGHEANTIPPPECDPTEMTYICVPKYNNTLD